MFDIAYTDNNNNNKEPYEAISSPVTKQPNGIFIAAGDFYQIDLKTLLSKVHQHVHTPPGKQIPLTMFTQTFLAVTKPSHPHFGQDHISLLLRPTYPCLLCQPSGKNSCAWIDEATAKSQLSFLLWLQRTSRCQHLQWT